MHLARLLFVDLSHSLLAGFVLITAFLILYQVVYIIIGILKLVKEIIKRINIDIIEGLKLIFLWGFFGGLLLNSYHRVVLEQDATSFIIFVFSLIIFLIASPLLFHPVIQAYNKFIDDNKKK